MNNRVLHWRSAKLYRRVSLGLVLLWLGVLFFPATTSSWIDLNRWWIDPYHLSGLFLLSVLGFLHGCLGLVFAWRGNGSVDLPLSLIAWPIWQLFVFTCDPFWFALIVATGVIDLLLCISTPPGTVSRVFFELWAQAKNEYRAETGAA